MTRLFSVEAWITQYFGKSAFANERYPSGFHNGLDIVPIDRRSWFVFAPVGGVVTIAEDDIHYGNQVTIHDHRFGAVWRFGHLESISLSLKDTINKGDPIGITGETGNVTGRHLHIDLQFVSELAVNDFMGSEYGGWMDPLPALRYMEVHI